MEGADSSGGREVAGARAAAAAIDFGVVVARAIRTRSPWR